MEIMGDEKMKKVLPIGAILQWQELQDLVNRYVQEKNPDECFRLMRQFTKLRDSIQKEMKNEKKI